MEMIWHQVFLLMSDYFLFSWSPDMRIDNCFCFRACLWEVLLSSVPLPWNISPGVFHMNISKIPVFTIFVESTNRICFLSFRICSGMKFDAVYLWRISQSIFKAMDWFIVVVLGMSLHIYIQKMRNYILELQRHMIYLLLNLSFHPS